MSTPSPDALDEVFQVRLPPRPYPGLRPFEKDEWPIYFGRERMGDVVVRELIQRRLLVVHGDSGCGKSSLVRAGVLPRLEQENARGGMRWRTCAATPGEAPLWNLAQALAGLDGGQVDEERAIALRRVLNFGADAPAALAKLLRRDSDDQICVLIDQFEELFEHARRHGPEEARLLTAFLVGLWRKPPDGLYLAITMRSEFLGACARFGDFAAAVNATQYLLPRMDHDDLLRAIREPATLFDGEVTSELAERMIADAGGAQDELPLIQHGLMMLMQRLERSGSSWRLGLEHFPDDGGLSGLLSDHADAVMLLAQQRHRGQESAARAVEDLFRAITDINADGQAIRRPRTLKHLAAVTGVDETVLRGIVDDFRADGVSFLRPYGTIPIDTERDLIDISHEALVRCWRNIADKKDGWLIREFRNGLVWRALLVQADSFDRNAENVLSPTSTGERVQWLKRRTPGWCERYGGGWERVQALMRASIESAEEAQREEQERLVAEEKLKRQELEVSAAKALAAAEVAKRRLMRAGLVLAVGLASVAAIFAFLAVEQRDLAKEQQQVAVEQQQKAELAADQLRDEVRRTQALQAQAMIAQSTAANAVASTVARVPEGQDNAVTAVLERIRQAADSYEVAVLAQSLTKLNTPLTPAQANAVVEALVRALGRSDQPAALSAVAQAIKALAPGLGAELSKPLLDPLLAVTKGTRDAFVRQALVDAVRALPLQLSAEQEQALVPIAPRVYVHIVDETQRVAAGALSAQLKQIQVDGQGVVVPGIQLVSGGTPKAVLRCFRAAECESDGKAIVDAVNRLLSSPEVRLEDLSARYEKSTDIRPRHYELWFASGDIVPRRMEKRAS